MTGEKTVTLDECRRMRKMRAKGYFTAMVAEEFDVSPTTVEYHALGHCAHPGDPVGVDPD